MANAKLVLSLFFHLILVPFVLDLANAQVSSLTAGFYSSSCPHAEYIVKAVTKSTITKAPTLAAPLLRMHFHDCFVRGCDGSVLLNSTSNITAEKESVPNRSLRGFQIIDAVKTAVEEQCPGVVSCADILALVARDAVTALGGPFWAVRTGRRDGRVSLASEVFLNLPAPTFNATQLKAKFASKGLNVKDLVVLSGAHTIGTAHCNVFSNRLYNFTGKGDMDPNMDANFIAELKKVCQPNDNTTLVEMDPGSFRTFDTHYYSNVKKRRGLFQSDASLLTDTTTLTYVKLQTGAQNPTFYEDFATSMMKMSEMGVITGSSGEIRKRCAFVN